MRQAAPALVLQTLWRSGGTWLWAGFRALGECRAYCEPLHESLARSSAEDLRQAFVGATQVLRHPDLDTHYFAEFPLAMDGGVALFPKVSPLARFVQDRDEDDSETALYLERLVGHAWLHGQLPVFKFCRAALRADWVRTQMPEAAMLYLNRNPDDLHRSYWSHGQAVNYFSVQYAASLLMQRQHRRWRMAADHLVGDAHADVVLDPSAISALKAGYQLCLERGEQFGRDLTLLYWVHALLDNERAGVELVDYDRLVDEPSRLDELLGLCRRRLGVVPHLVSPRRTLQPEPGGVVVSPALARCILDDIGASGSASLASACARLDGRSVRVIEALLSAGAS